MKATVKKPDNSKKEEVEKIRTPDGVVQSKVVYEGK